jgi:hypothetical protein
MIKLFRNIRKKLLEEGKITNYLKYAIGEIILVVIGILIALQINNWNEGRKTKQEESVILNNLLEDLNAAKIQSLVAIKKDSLTVNSIIDVLKDKDSFFKKYVGTKADSIAFELFWDTNPDIPVIVSYNDIKSSGKLSIISSKEIKDRFTLLEKSINNLSDIINDIISVQQIRIDEIAQNDLNFERIISTNMSISTEFEALEIPYNKVLENRKIRNLLSMKLSLINFVLVYRKKLFMDINILTDLINSEFNSHN